MTIRKKLTLWYAVLLTLIIILFGTITYSVMHFTMINSIDRTLSESASLIAENSTLRPVPTFGAPTRIEIDLAELDLFRASSVYVQAWEIVDGQPMFKARSANLGTLDTPLDPDALGTLNHIGHYSNVTISGVNLRVLTRPIMYGNRLVGNIQVAVDLSTVNRATDLLLIVMLVSCGIAILGAGGLSMWFSYRALKPIEEITRAASKIAGTNDLSTRLNWQGPNDELGRLISVFNRMMGRIEHLFSVQQRFVADISHELRTPLTAIQGNLQLAQRYGMDEMSMEAIENETIRMSRLVNDLLMLARADYGGILIDFYPLDLDTVVLETLEQAKSLAKDRDLEIKLNSFEPVRVNGNSDRIKQVMLNLIDNAIKFTPDGGRILVGLERTGQEAVVWVEDTGIGIQEEELQRVFDRFFQSDTARTHTGGGFGLGLSIVKWIVEAHGGTISVMSQPEKGTRFTIRIPVYQSTENHTPPGLNDPTRQRVPFAGRRSQHQMRASQVPHKSRIIEE